MTAGESGSYERVQLNPADRFGREIDPAVLKAAEQLAKRVFGYGGRIVGDPAVVADVLEESGAAVSRVLRKNQESSTTIRDLHAYLFRVFIRRVNRVLRRRPQLGKWDFPLSVDYRESLEHKLILDEFLRSCDPITREMLYRRIEGFSWKEIGTIHGISTHAAESRCGQALQRVRKKLGYKD
jgi:DNA-directed RNA polymerase specialized sigma24 family protein